MNDIAHPDIEEKTCKNNMRHTLYIALYKRKYKNAITISRQKMNKSEIKHYKTYGDYVSKSVQKRTE